MRRLNRSACVLCLLFFLSAVPAQAQDAAPQPLPPEPIGPFVVDVRGVMARFQQLPQVATALGVDRSELPTHGLGVSVGAHVYPLRRRRLALGVGAELLVRARASHTRPAPTDTAQDGPTVVSKMTAFSPQVSLNFGKRDGWSYVSAGLGPTSYSTQLETDAGQESEPRPSALNYGGGARWFAKKHVAFTFDIRFYAIRAQEASDTRPALPKVRLLVMSAGVSLR